MNALYDKTVDTSTFASPSGVGDAAQRSSASHPAARPLRRGTDSTAIRELAKTFREMAVADGRRARRRKPSIRDIAQRIIQGGLCSRGPDSTDVSLSASFVERGPSNLKGVLHEHGDVPDYE
jgi:hypothetical protein